ncbi:MAG: hypothetical protein ACJZ12_04580 [Candidatus Neomarinimicrobiota bacterium]
MIDFYRLWLPYIYLYLVGGGIFAIGMFIILKSNSLNRDRIRHSGWFYVLLFGFFYYVGIHGIFTFAAIGQITISIIIVLLIVAMGIGLVKILFIKSN